MHKNTEKNTEMKEERVGFRASAEIVGLMDAISDSILKRTGIKPNRTQIFELAIKSLAKSEKVSK